MASKIHAERKELEKHFNAELEKILNQNANKDTYWILGKVRFPDELGGKVARTFLQACDEKPGLIRDTFVYEVDNKKGVKTLLWLMNPDGTLRLPTLNKTIQAMPAKRQNVIAI